MPGVVKVRVLCARNLPVMDRTTDLTDAFVEVRIGSDMQKTDVAKQTLNPSWNTDWFCFELEDQLLQEESLQIRVMDHDTYTSHDAIGRVYFDLNPLLGKDCPKRLDGWFPIYDPMHGIRGEIKLAIRVDTFVDCGKHKNSPVDVKFMYSDCVPQGYQLKCVIGFVQELLVNDDPEYQWIEKIRTQRASNEARQRLFSRLSGEVRRRLGRKVLTLNGNAVLGFRLKFDLEGESGVVARAIGSACDLQRVCSNTSNPDKEPVDLHT